MLLNQTNQLFHFGTNLKTTETSNGDGIMEISMQMTFLGGVEAEYANKHHYSKHKPALPLYTRMDGITALNHFVVVPYHEEKNLHADFTFQFIPAGHIIGSAFIRIQYKNFSLLFTGDMGRPNDVVMKPPAIIHDADYLVIESTYGNRLHESEDPKECLKEVINKTIRRGGTIIVPSFAVGRSQILLYYLSRLKKEKLIPDIPIFLDSPMATNATDIFLKYRENLRLTETECRELNEVARFITTTDESKALDNNKVPKIIISASGMLTGGRVLFHLKTYAPDHRSTILFTGFQAMGTRGSRLMNGEKELKIHGELIPIKAEIKALSNLSAHADYAEILQWLQFFEKKPKKIFITHGEYEAASSLKQKIETKLGWKCIVPHYQQKETLSLY